VVGRELAVTVLDCADPGEGPRALPIVELFTPESFYSYEAHYTIGQLRMEVPAELSAQVRARVESVALESYTLMGCRDFARVDLILDEHDVPQVLEINTIPGLTETGITTAAAEAAGMTFAELVGSIVARVSPA
jgi:D-alanine-D-alanine ligase